MACLDGVVEDGIRAPQGSIKYCIESREMCHLPAATSKVTAQPVH